MYYLCEISDEDDLVIKDTENSDVDVCSLEDAREFEKLGLHVAFLPNLTGLNEDDLHEMNLVTFDVNNIAFCIRDGELYCDSGLTEFKLEGDLFTEDNASVELLDSIQISDTKFLVNLLYDHEEEEDYTFFLRTKCYCIDLVQKTVKCLAFMPKFIEPTSESPLDECARLTKRGDTYMFGDLAINVAC